MHGTKTGHPLLIILESLTPHRGAAVDPTHHRRGPISDLLVLQVSQFTQDLGSWVLHFQQLQDGRSIVGDGHVLSDEEEEILLLIRGNSFLTQFFYYFKYMHFNTGIQPHTQMWREMVG